MTTSFGLIIPGKLPQTNFTVVDEHRLVLNIGNLKKMNQMIVFLTGTQELPFASAGAIYLGGCTTIDASPTNWYYLGFVTNEKASAIFNIADLEILLRNPNRSELNIMIGISVEPLMTVAPRTPIHMAPATVTALKVQFGQKIIDSFMNHATNNKLTPQQAGASTGDLVPLTSVHRWFLNIRRRIENNMLS